MSDLRSAPDPADAPVSTPAPGKETVNAPASGGVKIYDRPERTGPSPAMLLLILVVAVILAVLLYMAFRH